MLKGEIFWGKAVVDGQPYTLMLEGNRLLLFCLHKTVKGY